ncbi:DBH-like monooxygenase protein 1 [Oculina patagonica]
MALYLSLIFMCLAKSSADLVSQHSFFAHLDEDQKVKLYWNVSTANKEIYFTVEAQTTGWVGFGISSGQGKMKGADIVIGWVKDGKPYFKDRHDAVGHVMPQIDSQQDYKLISLVEDGGKTIMKFKRKFETCDPQDNTIQEGTTKLIYAFHPDDPSSENNIPPHDSKSKGARSTFLLNGADNVPKLPDDTKSFNFTVNKTALPSTRTTYWYNVFEFPKLQKRHDIIKIDPIIQEGNEGVVHHMLLYECKDDFPRSNLSYEGFLGSPDMPPAVKECIGYSTFAAWAIGGQSFYFPEHVGFSIGEHDSPKIAILEIHYDNYEQKAGIVDSSGFRFHYTSQLRKYQAAMLSAGWSVSTSLVIPPNQANWETEGYCVEECTAEGLKGSTLPGGGIRIFAANLHTHLAGHAARTRHVRKGVELPEIIRDDHYDFNFQEFQIPSKEITVMPGDSLITVCDYRSEENMIRGGLGTNDEMCLSYLYYYPKVNLTRCWSNQRPAINKFYDKYVNPDPNGFKWTDKMASELRKIYQDTDEINAYCSGRNSEPLPGLGKKLVTKPVINSPLKKESECEEITSSSDKLASHNLVFAVAVVFMFIFSCIY